MVGNSSSSNSYNSSKKRAETVAAAVAAAVSMVTVAVIGILGDKCHSALMPMSSDCHANVTMNMTQ